MGCDIHLCAEVKIAGKWHLYAQPDIDRNYDLFEKMAGVRGEVEKAIAPPRGLPDDISEMTRFVMVDYWNGDGHSKSWLNAAEIAELAEWGRQNLRPGRGSHTDRWDMEWDWRCYLFGNSWEGFTKYDKDGVPKAVEDIRFVFCFDN